MEEIKIQAQKIVQNSKEQIILKLFAKQVKQHNPLDSCTCEYCQVQTNYVLHKRAAHNLLKEIDNFWNTNNISYWTSQYSKYLQLRFKSDELKDYKDSLKEI